MLILNIGGLTDESCCNKKSRCFRIYFEKNIRNKKRKKLRSIKIYTKLRQVQIILCICCNLCSKTGPDFINQNPLIEGVLPSILQLSRAKRSIIPISSFLLLPVLNATRSSCSTISFFSRTEKVLYPLTNMLHFHQILLYVKVYNMPYNYTYCSFYVFLFS